MSSCILFSKERNLYYELNRLPIYEHEVDKFIDMLRTGKMPLSYDKLIMPVAVISAILESLKLDREVNVNDFVEKNKIL